MGNVTPRTIIILCVMGAAILYGASQLFFPAGKPPEPLTGLGDTAQLNALIAGLAAMPRENPSSGNAYAIARAEAPWSRNPFFERKSYREWLDAKDPSEVEDAALVALRKEKIVYSGYLDMGEKKIALINGSEYVLGDPLAMEGYVLRDISPAKIVLYHKESKRSFDIPLQE